ncbi:ROK family protein [Rhizobiales bacterium RZME27]|jgi:N-acetylglucosamine kinase|uniref:N-acetylglucosamine kinase n=1 Tax=Endobacterium cereale TaxID=2663029 RepID=A0A6A8ACK9_9HYPH|nr:ROK family protein [Endobacterium cereale]
MMAPATDLPVTLPVFAADVGGSFIKFALSPGPGRLVHLERVPTPADDWAALCGALAGLLQRHADLAPSDAPLALSVAGLIEPVEGVATSANIPCITGRPLAGALAMALSRSVFAANDADCFTLAEANEGAGRGHAVTFCAIMGTGIGGGLAIDGRLARGAGGVTGEWGHGPIVCTSVEIEMKEAGRSETIHMPRLPCGCGQSGCADTIGGARGIERIHQHLTGRVETSHDILSGWQRGDDDARRTVLVYLELISDPLALAVNITGASIVPVGGGLASVDPLMTMLDRAVRSRILNRFDRPLVVPAQRMDDGGLIGAAVLGRQGLRMQEAA